MPHLHRASFSGHETFPFRYSWLKKAVEQVRQDPRVFGREDAMVIFGAGKNMVGSIRHWAMVCGVIEEDPQVSNNRGRSLRVTELGRRLLDDEGWDPYLEDPATLWLLHWQITNQPEKATTWYWVFNQLNQFEFDRRDLVAELLRLADQHGWARVAQTSVKRDVDCFVRTYSPMRATKRSVPEDGLDCPLVELGLLGAGANSHSFVVRRSDPSHLPAEVFVFGLVEYIRGREHDAKTVSLEEILFAPGAPGRVFALTEDGVMRRFGPAQQHRTGQAGLRRDGWTEAGDRARAPRVNEPSQGLLPTRPEGGRLSRGRLTMKLNELTRIERRYQKSIHLERDAASTEALAGYVVTPLVRKVLRRLAFGLRDGAEQRAWSITGPYGTGKTALAVLWSNLVGPAQEPRTKKARRLLSVADKDLASELYGRNDLAKSAGLVTVLATGERAPLEEVVLRALHASLSSFWSGRGAKPAVLRSVGAALKHAEQGKSVGTRRTVSLIEEAAAKICESANDGSGLVLVLDEAGKCLEFAAHDPARGDVQLLQELAEAANRSAERPILFITILHQSIERYAGRLGGAQRNEWAKVQGRFEDIAFQEEADQLLRLIAAAVGHPKSLPKKQNREFVELAAQVAEVASGGQTEHASPLAEQLSQLFPLHPVSGLLLGPLFRTRLAQNERSLFGFLSSGEPLGFQAHLDQDLGQRVAENLYRVDHLYDYVVSALGTQLYGQDGRAWAEIDTALRRLPKDAERNGCARPEDHRDPLDRGRPCEPPILAGSARSRFGWTWYEPPGRERRARATRRKLGDHLPQVPRRLSDLGGQ